MKRVVSLFLLFLLLGMAGCKSQTPSVDPFFGRTTIAPPSTGSISGQGKDPYYQTTPPPQYNPSYPLQQVPQNYPGLNAPPANISPPPANTPNTTPGATPATPPGSTWPGGNRYMPPGGNFNYQGSSAVMPNSRSSAPSPNRISTPFFAGGTPSRSTIPIADNSPRPIDDAAENPAGPNPSVSSSAVTYNSGGNARESNISLTGRSPGARPLQAQPQDQSYSQSNNNSLPAARRLNEPVPAERPNDSIKPAWRESTSFESSDQADKTVVASDVETKGASSPDAGSPTPASSVRLASGWEKTGKPADKTQPIDPNSDGASQAEVEKEAGSGGSN